MSRRPSYDHVPRQHERQVTHGVDCHVGERRADHSVCRLDRKRKTIRLGDETEAAAELVAVHVENWPAQQTAWLWRRHRAWVAKLDGPLADKLAKVGLLDDRLPATLGAFTQAYIDGRGTSSAIEGQLEQRGATGRSVRPLKPMAGITEATPTTIAWAAAEQVGEHLLALRPGQAIFRVPCRKRCECEPVCRHENLQSGPVRADYLVPWQDDGSCLGACPNAQWRLLFALRRYGACGARRSLASSPGPTSMGTRRMTVRSPKTERHEGTKPASCRYSRAPAVPEAAYQEVPRCRACNHDSDAPPGIATPTRARMSQNHRTREFEAMAKAVRTTSGPLAGKRS